MAFRKNRGGGGGGGGSGLSLEEIGSVTPDWGTHSAANTLAGDTSPGTGIDLPSRVPTGELWAVHVGDEDIAGENIYIFYASAVPDVGDAAGATATETNSCELRIGAQNINLTWGAGDKLLVSRNRNDRIANGTVVTLYRVQAATDDFARALSASLDPSTHVLTVSLTRDGASALSATVDLSGLVSDDTPNVPRWVSNSGYAVGDLARDQEGNVYVCITAITAGSPESRRGSDASANWASVNEFRGTWVSGMYLHRGNVVYHSGAAYFALNDVGPSTTAPASDATNFLPLRRDTNLSVGERTATTMEIESSTGDNVTLPAASTTKAGLLSAADKQALGVRGNLPPTWSIGTYAEGDQRIYDGRLYVARAAHTSTAATDNPAADTDNWAPVDHGTDLSVARDTTALTVRSSSGRGAVIPAATESLPGLQSAGDKAQMDALPPRWQSGTHDVGDQVVHGEKLYVCLVAREATDTEAPPNDSTGWATAGSGGGTGGANTNLGLDERDEDSLDITSSTGTDVTVPSATTTRAGLQSGPDKAKLDAQVPAWTEATYTAGDQRTYQGVLYVARTDHTSASATAYPSTDATNWAPAGTGSGTGGGATNLAIANRDADSLDITSSTGTDVTLPAATATEAGLATAADKTNLDAQVPVWTAAVYAVGDQRIWARRLYRCIAVRAAGDTDNPATDTTGWAPVAGTDHAGQTDLSIGARDADSLEVRSSTGTNAEVPAATTTQAGLESAADKAKSDAYPAVWVAGAYQTRDQRVYNGRIYVRTGAAGTDGAAQNPSANSAWEELGESDDVMAATTTRAGIVELATQAEANALTDTDRAVTPGRIPKASTSQEGIVELATTAEANALADMTRALTPGRVPTASEAQDGVIGIADNTQTDGGTDNAHAMTPVKVHRVTGAKVSAAEITAGTETTVRRMSPADVVGLATAHIEPGLDQAAVDARVVAGTQAEARAGNTDAWPDNKIPAGITRDTELNSAIASFRTGTQITSEITAAIAAIDDLEYQGAWSAATAYSRNDVVIHSGATYLATQNVGANTRSTTEPGAGLNWRNFWDRLGYEDGPPNAFVGVTRDNQVLTFTRESEENPLELTLPPGGDSAYAFRARNELSPANVTSAQTIPTSGTGYEVTLLDEESIVGEVQPDNDFIVDWEGGFSGRVTVAGTLHVILKTTHEFNGKTFVHSRTHQLDVVGNASFFVPMNVFNTRSQVSLGAYRTQAGVTVQITEADLRGPTTITYTLEFQLHNRRAAGRKAGNLAELYFEGMETTAYQLGAYKSGGGSSRGNRLYTSNALPTASETISTALSGVTWTRDTDETAYTSDGVSIVLPLQPPGNDRDVIGLWFVGEEFNASGTVREYGNLFVPWGSFDFGNEPLFVSGSVAPRLNSSIVSNRIRYNLRGAGAAIPANRRIVVYEALAGAPGRDGVTGFSPTDLGTHTFALDGTAAEVALTDSEGDAIICPASGYVIATVNVPTAGLVGSMQWMFAEDLRAAENDATLTAGLYTNESNQIFLHLAAQDGGASTGNEVIIQHIGVSTDESAGAETAVLPSIARFDLTGNAHPAPGSIAGDRYSYDLAISQSSHAASARIVGFAGAPVVSPPTVSVLRTVASLHAENGVISIPAGVSLAAAGDSYTVRLEVYATGKTPAEDDPTAYQDFVITARAPAAEVHFGTVSYDSDESLAQHASRIVFADDDIATGGSGAGTWTFSGLADTGEFVPYLAVPTTLTQPTRFTQSNFDIEGITSVARTIGGTAYRIWMYALDSRVDSSANGSSIVSYTS